MAARSGRKYGDPYLGKGIVVRAGKVLTYSRALAKVLSKW
jgi:hypothetical protein